ncbi:MAG: 4'-phosphopantetheinyl transferase family protein [Flavicella sp.]
MPFLKSIPVNPQTTVYVWKIDESMDYFSSISLNNNSKERLKAMRSETHQKGFLSIRKLLEIAGYGDDELYYNQEGKPFLKDGTHISISHSYEFAALIMSDQPVGIDIEKNRNKIVKIASKFVGTEQSYVDKLNPLAQLSVIWGGKEALYKIVETPGISFKNAIHIAPFTLKNLKAEAYTLIENIKTEYTIHFETLDNFTLVYALKK